MVVGVSVSDCILALGFVGNSVVDVMAGVVRVWRVRGARLLRRAR